MSKIAFIFPGQGAQVCGMGQDFYEQMLILVKLFLLFLDVIALLLAIMTLNIIFL